MTAGTSTLPNEIATDKTMVPTSRKLSSACQLRPKIPNANSRAAITKVFSRPNFRDIIGATNELMANAVTGIVPNSPMTFVLRLKSCWMNLATVPKPISGARILIASNKIAITTLNTSVFE